MIKENYFAQAKRERLAWIGTYIGQILAESETHSVSYGKVLDMAIMKFGLTEKRVRDDMDLIIRVNGFELKEGMLKKAEVTTDGTLS